VGAGRLAAVHFQFSDRAHKVMLLRQGQSPLDHARNDLQKSIKRSNFALDDATGGQQQPPMIGPDGQPIQETILQKIMRWGMGTKQ
jgi:hypothetical protein